MQNKVPKQIKLKETGETDFERPCTISALSELALSSGRR